jgi:Subtilase family
MLDNSNQPGSSNGLNYNSLTDSFSSSDLSVSSLLNHRQLTNLHMQQPSSVVLSDIRLSKEFPDFKAQQIGTADLNLNDIFLCDRRAQIHGAQVHTKQELYDNPLGFDRDILTGETVNEPLVGRSNNPTLIGIIDTGFSAKDPYLKGSSVQLGHDRIENDANPLVQTGDQHGTHILDAIAAKDGHAPLWLGRAVGSGKWADSLVEFVDSAKTSGQTHAIVNLSFDLTQINPDGSISTRQQLTSQEREALTYAQQNGVLIVAAAGNTGKEMSALGQASQEFDNIITVGSAKGFDRASYSSYGKGLTLLAKGDLHENGKGNVEGTSIATAQVTGAVSQVWAKNPDLGYRQVIDILKETATDLKEPGQDSETGAGLLNQAKALDFAALTAPVSDHISAARLVFTSQTANNTTLERPALFGVSIPIIDDVVDAGKNVVSTGIDVAKDAVNTGVDATQVVVNTGIDVAKDIGNGAVSVGKDVVNGAAGVAQGAAGGIVHTITDAINRTVQSATDLATGAIQSAIDLANGVFHSATDLATGHPLDAVGTLANTAVGLGGNVLNTTTQVASNGIQTAGSVTGDVIHTAGNVAGTAVSGAGSIAGEVIHTAGNVTGAIVSTVDPRAGAAIKAVGNTGATVANSIGNGISTGIQVGTDVAGKVVTEKITGILQRGAYQVQAFPDRLKRLGQDVAKNPTDGFGKWIGQVGIDLAETLGIPEDAESIADLLKPETRALTASEIKLAQGVFGNSINYRLVRLDEAAKTVDWTKQIKGFTHPRPFTTFHTINSWGKLENETLIHELTHVWQYEHGGAKYIPEALAVNGKRSGYDYKGVSNLRKLKAAHKGMSSFNPEQQAKIVEEYFLVKTGQASKAGFSGGATRKDLPTYTHFVKEVSTLSEKTLDV